MPTPLPTGRRFWRRYAPEADTLRNLTATTAEFGLALGFVAVVVLIIVLSSPGPLRLSF